MKLEVLNKMDEDKFRRATGVKRKTFEEMVRITREADKKKREQGGRPSKTSIEEQVLMTLEYLREYRTYQQIGISYGVSESAAYKTIKFVEDSQIKSESFRLPGKKVLRDKIIEVVMVDATESPIERPKKNKKNSTQEKRKGTA